MRVEFRLGANGLYRCEQLNGFEFSTHGFGSRLANPHANITLRQIHSSVVWNANGLADRECEGDALVSGDPGVSIGIRTADCVPILLLDPKTHAVAAVHAGWRGTVAQIVMKTISRLTADFGSVPSDLHAAIGPSIRECCYQVGPEVAREFVLYFPEWSGEIGTRTIDLPETNRRQMLSAGLPDAQIFDSSLCTACTLDRLFSYRREPANPGRMIAAISRLF